MEFNKDHIIYLLLGVILLLSTYIYFKEPIVKTNTKVEYETVFEDNIIYKDMECKEKIVYVEKEGEGEFEEDNDSIDEELIKEYTVASINDSKHMYKINIFSYEEPSNIKGFKKVVLNSRLKNNEYESIFVMDLNQILINEVNDVFFKIINLQTKEVYISNEPCLNNVLENYIYKVDLEITGNEIICNVFEDRELEYNVKDEMSNLKSTLVKSIPKGIVSPLN